MGEYRKLQDRAVRWLRREIRLEGLEKVLRVSGRALTRADLSRLVRSVKTSRVLSVRPPSPAKAPPVVKAPQKKPVANALRDLTSDLLGGLKR
jgi:hypothetical protein